MDLPISPLSIPSWSSALAAVDDDPQQGVMHLTLTRMSTMLCSLTHYRQLTWLWLLKVFTPVIGGLASPPSFKLHCS
jgi:hypothetical protein